MKVYSTLIIWTASLDGMYEKDPYREAVISSTFNLVAASNFTQFIL